MMSSKQPGVIIQAVDAATLMEAVRIYRAAAAPSDRGGPGDAGRWVRGYEHFACTLLHAGTWRADGRPLRDAETWRRWAASHKSRRLRVHKLTQEVWWATLETYRGGERSRLESAIRVADLQDLVETAYRRLKVTPFAACADSPTSSVTRLRLQ